MQSVLIASKIRTLYVVLFIFSCLLILFTLRWQVVEASKFTNSLSGLKNDAEIPALRGTIYASDNSTLAYSEPTYNLYIFMPDLLYFENKGIQTRQEFTQKVGVIIDMSPETLGQQIQFNQDKGINWFRVKESLSLEQGESLRALRMGNDPQKGRKLVGYSLVDSAKRIYPEGKLAAQVLGLTEVKDDGARMKTLGRGGIEGEWNGFLEPLIGFISGEKDAKGNAVGLAAEKTIEAKRGSSIQTTIDKHLQKIIEAQLEAGVKKYSAESGSAIVMDPRTGHIMALANYPTYDPNLRDATDSNVYGNKAVSEPYEIGSVGKVYTLAAAIDLGVVNPDTVVVQGHKGCEKIHEKLAPICTADGRPRGPMGIKDAFRASDNIYFLHLARLMTKQQFFSYLDKFGMGKPTGVGLSGEDSGTLKDPAKRGWNAGDLESISFGHSYLQTALQATTAVGALANYGVRMQPQIVSKIVDPDGTEKSYEPTPVAQVVSKQTAQMMDEMMYNVYKGNISDGEYHYYHLRKYKIAMKSGTALIAKTAGATIKSGPGYSSDYNATYVGYDASPDRKFVMLIRLEKPKVGTLSSHNARAVWLDSFNAIRGYLGIKKISEY